MTSEVIESIHEKNRLYRKAYTSNSQNEWVKYKIARKHARMLFLHTKEEVLKSQIRENFSNPRRFWRKINDIIGNNKQSKCFSTIHNDDEVKLENQEAADFMNEYFTNIGKSLNANNSSTWHAHSFFRIEAPESFSLNVVTSEIVLQYVRKMNVSKPSGIPFLNNKVLKDALSCIPFEITSLLNNSIVSNYFPAEWKNGIITPIPKTGNLTLKSNWRPITILNSVGKLLEKIVHYQTCIYLQFHEILTEDQHGFRRNHSTSSAIFEFLKDIYENIRKKEVMGCVYIDYQKAFDTINHNILFSKLHLYGFSQNCIEWFKSYLTGRTQCTKCNTEYISSPKAVTLGVPQGSTLGPLLFIIYVNDICHIRYKFDVKIKMYADDTVIYATGNDIETVRNTLQLCTNYVYNWCFINRLYMNMKKTKIMWFGADTKKIDSVDAVTIMDVPIEYVPSYHYLGIELDSLLSFDKHMDNTVKKCNQKLYIFRRIRRFISEKTAILIYKQTIRPLDEYCSFIFNSGKKSKIDKIDRIQSKCVRIIEYCYDNALKKDEKVLCQEYGISSLQLRRDSQLASIMYRYSKNELFVKQTANREKECEGKIRFNCIFSKVSKIRKSPFYRGVDLWNTLKVSHHRAENKKRFKSLLAQSWDWLNVEDYLKNIRNISLYSRITVYIIYLPLCTYPCSTTYRHCLKLPSSYYVIAAGRSLYCEVDINKKKKKKKKNLPPTHVLQHTKYFLFKIKNCPILRECFLQRMSHIYACGWQCWRSHVFPPNI